VHCCLVFGDIPTQGVGYPRLTQRILSVVSKSSANWHNFSHEAAILLSIPTTDPAKIQGELRHYRFGSE
jgi:hypothetical protein